MNEETILNTQASQLNPNAENKNCTLTLSRDELYHALKMISGVVHQNQTIKILSHVLFKVALDNMTLAASDSEMELEVNIPARQNEDRLQSFTLSARNLMELCRSTAAGSTMHWHLKGAIMHVEVGSATFQLNTLNEQDFPLFPRATAQRITTVSAKTLSHALANTSFAMGLQDVRQYLNGLAFQATPEELTFGATDAHRLSVHRCKIEGNKPFYTTLPRKAVLEVWRLVKALDENLAISIHFHEQHIIIQSDAFTLRSLRLQGPELQFERLLPKQCDQKAAMSVQALLSALQRSTVLLQDKTAHTILSFEPGRLNILSMNFEQEKTEEDLAIDYEGDAFQVTLNAHYVCDVLNVMPDDDVTIEFFGQNNALHLTSSSDTHQANFVIMPISISS
jgi:DNA polymerase III subunit beta